MNAVMRFKQHAVSSYPNAATRGYFLDKIAAGFLAAAICVGIVSILYFLAVAF